jgi:acid phosphatase type 7
MSHEESGSPSDLYYYFDAAASVVCVTMLGSYTGFDACSDQHTWLAWDLARVDHRTTLSLMMVQHELRALG